MIAAKHLENLALKVVDCLGGKKRLLLRLHRMT
jgi:hypothetical protein